MLGFLGESRMEGQAFLNGNFSRIPPSCVGDVPEWKGRDERGNCSEARQQ